MPKKPVSLLVGDTVDDNVEYRSALPVNMYATVHPVLETKGYLTQHPGLTFLDEGEGKDRGGVYNDRLGAHLRVSGTSLVEILADGTSSVIGEVHGANQVTMQSFYSFNTQAIIADGRMYLYDRTNGLVRVTDSDLGSPIDGTWINGYYFLTDGEFIYHTDISDETSISPLKYATSEFSPDATLAVDKTQDNKVLVFNRYSLEYFVDRANDNFAFTRLENRAQKIGIVATRAKCELNGLFYFTGSRKNQALSVYSLSVSGAEKVASKEVEEILASYTEAELVDMTMEIREERRSSFIQINLPKHTLLYNSTVAGQFGVDNAWAILKSDVTGDMTYRAINGVYDPVLNKWVYGDKFNTNIGYLNNNITTEYGSIVEWILYSAFIYLDGVSIDELEMFTIPGKNSINDATVACSATSNGRTWSPEFWLTYSEVQDYEARFIARALGDVREKIAFKFRGASTARMAFSGFRISYG